MAPVKPSKGVGLVKGLIGKAAGAVSGFLEDVDIVPTKTPRITVKCPSCHAPLTGKTGKRVTCQYCDTEHMLG